MAGNNEIKVHITAENEKFVSKLQEVVSAIKSAEKSTTKSFGNPFERAVAGGSTFLDTLSKVSMAGYGIVGMLQSIKGATETVFGTGLGFDKQMETAKLGVAGILTSMTNLNDKQMDLNSALAISQKYIDKINQKATDIGLNPTELIAGFQTAVAPGLKANMDLDEITDIVAMYTKAVKTQLGAQANEMQISQEIRSVLSGSIDQNSTVARNMGITNEGVEQAKQTAGGLFKYLQEKMSGIGEVAEKEWPNSMAGALDALKAKYSQASGSAFETVFDTAKVKIKELSDALFVVDENTKKISFDPELLSYLQSAVNYSILFGDKVIVAGKFISTYLLGPLNGVGGLLAFIINNLYGVTTALVTWVVIKKFIKAMDEYSAAAIKAKIETQALGNAGVTAGKKITAGTVGATVAIGRMEAAIGTVKVALRGLASATLWGAIAMAAGWALEKVINKLDKTTEAKNRLTGGISSTDLGALSQRYESSGDPGSISNPGDDPGGRSYGLYQLSINMGSLQNFVDWLESSGWQAGRYLKYGEDLNSGIPAHSVELGSDEFNTLWKNAADKFGESFSNAQEQYIKEHYYDATAQELANDGFDVNERSAAVRQAVWSTSVQHGPSTATDIIEEALANALDSSDEALINAIYDVRTERIKKDAYLTQDLKDAVIDRYNGGAGERQAALNNNVGSKSTPQDGTISLKEKEQEKKEITNARIKQLEAQASGDVQKYIADLELEASSLDRRYNNTKSGTAENPISVEDYIAQRKAIEQAKADKELELIQMKMSDAQQKSTVSDLKPNEKIDLQTEVTNLQTQYDLRQKSLQKVFQELDALNNDELRQLLDAEAELKASALESQGKIEEATKIRQEIKNRAQRQKFIVNSFGEGLSALEQVNRAELLNAKFTQTQKNLEYANNDLTESQEVLLSQLAIGAISATQVTETYIEKFHTLMDKNLAELKTELEQAISIGDKETIASIKAKIKEVTETLKNGINEILDKIQKNVDWQTKMIDVNPTMTARQKENAKKNVDAEGARQNVAALDALINSEYAKYNSTNNADFKNVLSDMILLHRQQLAYNEELAKVPSLMDDVHSASKQAFEDGLVTFLTDGINEAENFKEAFLDLVESILKSIQQVFAKKITDDLMNQWFPSESNSKLPDQPDNSAGIVQTLDGNFNNITTSTNSFLVSFDAQMNEFSIKAQSAFSSILQTIQNATNAISIGSTSTTSSSGTSGSSFSYTSQYGSNWWDSLSKFAEGGSVSKGDDGGLIKGAGTGTSDSILGWVGNQLIRVANGEFIFNAEAVKRIGLNTLERLNNGDIHNLQVTLPKFSTGGHVGRAGSRGMSTALENLTTNISTGVSPRLNVNNYVDGQRVFDTYGRSLIKSEVRKEHIENAKFYSQINKRMR